MIDIYPHNSLFPLPQDTVVITGSAVNQSYELTRETETPLLLTIGHIVSDRNLTQESGVQPELPATRPVEMLIITIEQFLD
jgi:hypothetical protein